MFVDACAIVSMMAGEDTAVAYEAALLDAASPFTSTLAAWEAIIVLSRPDQLNCAYKIAEAVVVEWLDAPKIRLREPGSPKRVLSYAVAVAEEQGIGKRRQQFRLFSLCLCQSDALASAYAGSAFASDRRGSVAEKWSNRPIVMKLENLLFVGGLVALGTWLFSDRYASYGALGMLLTLTLISIHILITRRENIYRVFASFSLTIIIAAVGVALLRYSGLVSYSHL